MPRTVRSGPGPARRTVHRTPGSDPGDSPTPATGAGAAHGHTAEPPWHRGLGPGPYSRVSRGWQDWDSDGTSEPGARHRPFMA
eukprot:474529-Hanusia_phi.AAC.1